MSSAAAICCSLLAVLPGHVLPDGFVERGVDVLVFPDRVEIRYRLGLSDGQMREELLLLADREAASGDPESAWSRFRELMGPEVVRGVVVRVDGQPRPLRLVSVEPWVSHHVSLQVVASVDVEVTAQPMSIDVRDELPLGQDVRGVTRMALRGRRDVEVIDSTGPANLVRAERMPIVAGPDGQVPTNCRIAASLRLPTAGDTDGAGTDIVSGQVVAPPPEPAKTAASSTEEPDSESGVSQENDPVELSPEATVWLVTVGLVFVAIGVLLMIRQLRSRR